MTADAKTKRERVLIRAYVRMNVRSCSLCGDSFDLPIVVLAPFGNCGAQAI